MLNYIIMSKDSRLPTSNSSCNMSGFYDFLDDGDLTADPEIVSDFRNDPNDVYISSPEDISRIGSTLYTSSPSQGYTAAQQPPSSRSSMDHLQNAPGQPAANRGHPAGTYASGTNFPAQHGGFDPPMGNIRTGFGTLSVMSQSQGPADSVVGGHPANQQRNGDRRQTSGSRRREGQGRESSWTVGGDFKQFQGLR